MELTLRVVVYEDLRSVLARDAIVAAECDLEVDRGPINTVFEVVSDNRALPKILELSRGTSGLVASAEVVLGAVEVDEVNAFEIYPRKVVYETERDSAIALYYHQMSQQIGEVDGAWVKRLRGAVMARIKLRPNMIAAAGDWREELVVPKLIADSFERSALCGFELIPIFNPKTQEAYEEFFLLDTDHVMPACVRDSTVIGRDGRQPGELAYSRLGLLTYAFGASEKMSDFNLTHEPWGSNNSRLWVVSKRCRDCFEGGGFKGCDFKPVLEIGSDLHGKYAELWGALLDAVSKCPEWRFA